MDTNERFYHEVAFPLYRAQQSINDWRKKNFPTTLAVDQLLGVVEEVGELSHAHLKQSQNIRGTSEEHRDAARDAVGDILIYLMGYCTLRGWNIGEILTNTLIQVSKRDWINDPTSGGE